MHAVSFESLERLTQPEFARFVASRDDLYRYELLNGRVLMTPPTGWPGGEAELDVALVVAGHVKAHDLGRVFGPAQGFELPSGDTVGPDVAWVSADRWAAGPAPVEGEFLRMVPNLVIEVLSRSTASRDRGEKKAIYARNGVEEYWLVDLSRRVVTRFVLVGDDYDQGVDFGEDEHVQSTVLPRLEAAVADLVAAVR